MTQPEKVDFKQTYRELYSPPSQTVAEVVVPDFGALMIDGAGDPNGEDFRQAVEALYSLSYTIKFWAKKHPAPPGYIDYVVPPLEALWRVESADQGALNIHAPRDTWRWTAMIMQPNFVTLDLVEQARNEVSAKKPNPSLERIRFEVFKEGRAVQILHLGPYSDELPNIMKLDQHMRDHNYTSNGLHHEIYLSDPRRTAPEKLRTILRHPVQAKA